MIRWGRTSQIGIDLGSHSVKLAELAPAREEVAARTGAAPIELDPEPSGEVWLDLVEGAIRIAAEQADIRLKGHRAAFLLPARWTEIRSLPAPNLQPDTPPDEVARYVEQELGSDLAGCVWDYWLVEPGGDRTELLIVFTRSGYADRIAQLAARLGCELVAIDALPWTHYRLFRLALPQQAEGGIILEWGLTHAWFTLVGADAPLYCRKLPRISFTEVVERLAHALGLHRDAVLAALRQEAERTGQEAKLWNELLEETSQAVVHRFADEVQRTCAYVRSRFGHQGNVILASGGVFALEPVRQQVANLLEQRLEQPARDGLRQWRQFPVFANSCALATSEVAHAL